MTTPKSTGTAQPRSGGEHTPGPWRVNTDNQQIGDVWSIPADVPVAQAQMIGSLRHPNHEERRANARLIAAVPELLAACKRSLSWLSSYPGGGAVAVYDQVEATIAKAESAQ